MYQLKKIAFFLITLISFVFSNEVEERLAAVHNRVFDDFVDWSAPRSGASLRQQAPLWPGICANNTVCNYQNAVVCKARRVYRPTTVEEVQAAVRAAASANVTARAMGRPHSDNGCICAEGDDGVLVLLDHFNRSVSYDAATQLITVQSGMTLGALNAELHQRGRALAALYPAYRGLTIAGVIGTGAHLSSLKMSSATGDALVNATYVNGDGELRTVRAADLDAWRTSLGALGILVHVTFATVKQYKVRMRQSMHGSDYVRDGRWLDDAQNSLFYYAGWFHNAGQVVVRSADAVPLTTPGDAHNDFLRAPGGNPRLFVRILAGLMEASLEDPSIACELEAVAALTEALEPPFLAPNGTRLDDAVGYSHLLLAADISEEEAPWNNGMRLFEMEIGIGLSHAQAALTRLDELLAAPQNALCFPLQGIYFRVERHSSTWLDMGSGGDAFVIGISSWRPLNGAPRYHEHAYAAIESMLIDEFDGVPHWGKNSDVVFAKAGLPQKYARWSQFWTLKKELDAAGRFDNAFIDALNQYWT